MRILYLCLDRGIPMDGAKGASVHVAEFLRALEAEGHETAVMARSGTPTPATRGFPTASEPARFRWVPGPVLRRDLREASAGRHLRPVIRDAVDRFRPDLVYERYALFRTEGMEAARAAGLPFVLEVNAPLAWEEARFRGLALRRHARRVERRMWTEADLVVVPSRPLAASVAAVAPGTRVIVVPNGVDADRFSPSEGASALRRELGIDDRFVVGFAGSPRPWHDLGTVLDAVALLDPALRASVMLVGEGTRAPSLRARARGLGVHVVSVGAIPHDRVPLHLQAMDVCVAPLSSDPELRYFAPLKALEYLAAGRPTVVAEAGDLGDVVRGGAALGYPPGDARALADRLATIGADPLLGRRLGAAGRAFAEVRTWRAAVRAVLTAVQASARR